METRLRILVGLAMLIGCTSPPQKSEDNMKGAVSYLNPEGLHRNPAFSQVVVASGRTRTVYVGGQNAVDASGTIVGKETSGLRRHRSPGICRLRSRLPTHVSNTS